MKHNIFETRQRAGELMHEALNIWRDSDQSDALSGLEKDPVFNVIMSALAYQANDFDDEIAQLKEDILEEFEKLISVGAKANAVPATTAMQVNALGSVPVSIDENSVFRCKEAEADFISLLKSRVFNIKHYSVERLDGRRWRVGIDLPESISSLEGMTFAISDQPFHDLRVSVMVDGSTEIPVDITAPWELYNMPMTEPFSLDTLIYNRTRTVSGGGENGCISPYQCNCAMDLFAQQGLSLYYIGRQAREFPQLSLSRHIDFCFEFDGLGEKFFFNEAQLAFNVLLLANVSIRTATLSKDKPVTKLVGGDEDDFLYLLRPDVNQMLALVPVDVRKVDVDRFNRSNLIRLLNNLIARFQTDYYAFIESSPAAMESHVQDIIASMKKMLAAASQGGTLGRSVYLQFNSEASLPTLSNLSLNVRYLVTKGDSINKKFNQKSKFSVPAQIDESRCRQIVPPKYGHNAIRNEKEEMSLRRYLMTTNDRLVTPYDIQLFCYNEMLLRYNIVREMVEDITIKHELMNQGSYHSYVIGVHISLVPNSFVHRALDGIVPTVEKYLEKMIQVRTSGIYPVRVSLEIMG